MGMTPGLFIGIGGTGLKTLTRLKVKIYNQYILAGATKDDFERENHFIFIDTDENDKSALQNDPIVRKGYPDLLIKNDEFINMGETNPYAIYTLDKEKKNLLPKPKRMMEWVVPQGKGKFILRNQKLSKGAGAERNVGRFGTYSCYEEICQNINAGISKLNLYLGKQNITPPNDSDDEDIKKAYKKKVADSQAPIWVFASANGGTGSSSLLDILYIIDRQYQRIIQAEPSLRVVLYMPETFKKMNLGNENYSLNAFSTFWELNAFKSDYIWSNKSNDKNRFRHFAVAPEKTEWQNIVGSKMWPLYSFIIPVDVETEKNKPIAGGIDKLYENIAEIIFYMQASSAGGKMVSNLDNDLRVFVGKDQSEDHPIPWTKTLIGAGYKVLRKADEEFESYLNARFLYDILEYGVIGRNFNDIHLTDSERIETKESFADKCILSLLINSKKGLSPYNLENSISNDLSQDSIPLIIKNIEKGGVLGIGGKSEQEIKSSILKNWTLFKDEFDSKIKDVKNKFDNKTDNNFGRSFIIELINSKVREGAAKNIIRYGLKHTEQLLYLVDDMHLEKESKKFEIELQKDFNDEKKDEVLAILNSQKSPAGLMTAGEDYRKFETRKLFLTIVIEILNEITKPKVGILETLRKGTDSKPGIADTILKFELQRTLYKNKLEELAKNFKHSSSDVFVYRIPEISSFVSDGSSNSSWNDNHEFEYLYSSLVEIKATNYRIGNGEMGMAPTRFSDVSDGKTMDKILEVIISKMDSNFFINLAETDKFKQPFKNIDDFIVECSKFIDEKSLSGPIADWRSKDLGQMVEYYKSKDPGWLVQLQQVFSSDIPILYPRLSNVKGESERLIFAGDKDLAKLFGYIEDPSRHQHVSEINLTNSLFVIRLELQLSLKSYKYFNDYYSTYKKYQDSIKNGDWGCNTHYLYCHLDLDIAVNKITGDSADTLNSFVELSFYDTCFKFIAEKHPEFYSKIFDTDSALSASDKIKIRTGLLKRTITHNSIISFDSNGNLDINRLTLRNNELSFSGKARLSKAPITMKLASVDTYFRAMEDNVFKDEYLKIESKLNAMKISVPVKSDLMNETFNDEIFNEIINTGLFGKNVVSEVNDEANPESDIVLGRILKIIDGLKANNLFIK